MNTHQASLQACEPWWFCENILNHPEQVGLLRMDFPQVFILIRDYGQSYFATYEEFRDHIAEVNFFRPQDRAEADLDAILTEAWNFLSLFEEEEENLYEEADEFI